MQIRFDLANICQPDTLSSSRFLYIQSKYLTPSWLPLCFPLLGLSHSTPSHSPVVPCNSPKYRTVHLVLAYDSLRPMYSSSTILDDERTFERKTDGVEDGKASLESGPCATH